MEKRNTPDSFKGDNFIWTLDFSDLPKLSASDSAMASAASQMMTYIHIVRDVPMACIKNIRAMFLFTLITTFVYFMMKYNEISV